MIRWSPPSCTATVRHSNAATVPSISGAPDAPGRTDTSRDLSSAGGADCRARWSWSAPSTFTAKCVAAVNTGVLDAVLAGHHSTSGGSRDTDVNEFAVMPTGSPSGPAQVTMVTPVAY